MFPVAMNADINGQRHFTFYEPTALNSLPPSRLAWSEGWRPLDAVLHSSNEPGELSQWFCHYDGTINIGICIIIIIIIIITCPV